MIAQLFSGAVVYQSHRPVEFFCYSAKDFLSGKKLAEQSVYLLIQAPFIRAARMAKVVGHAEPLFQLVVSEEFSAPIDCYRVNKARWQEAKSVYRRNIVEVIS